MSRISALHKALRELLTRAYLLGVAHGSHRDFFAAGKHYRTGDLWHEYDALSASLEQLAKESVE